MGGFPIGEFGPCERAGGGDLVAEKPAGIRGLGDRVKLEFDGVRFGWLEKSMKKPLRGFSRSAVAWI